MAVCKTQNTISLLGRPFWAARYWSWTVSIALFCKFCNSPLLDYVGSSHRFCMLFWGCRFVPLLHSVWVGKGIYRSPPYRIVRGSLLTRCENIKHNIYQDNPIGSIIQGYWAIYKWLCGLACPFWAPTIQIWWKLLESEPSPADVFPFPFSPQRYC